MVVLLMRQGYHGGSAYVTGGPWWFCLCDRGTTVVIFM